MGEAVRMAVKAAETKKENQFSQVQKGNLQQSISSPVEQILFLQRTIGNQAVQRLMKSGALQAKLRIGAPGDVYEEEADQVAEQIMRMPEPHVQRDETKEEPPAKPKINYATAEKKNKEYAAKLDWDSRLAEIRPEWAALWKSGDFSAFADSVASFQVEQGFEGAGVDGVLGPFTWDRLRPIGEVIAEQKVSWEKSKEVCSIATEERLKKGYKRATGMALVPEEEVGTFRIILHSIASKILDVDEEYRGTGAAGALVYLGKGEFVSESDIWDAKALLPGAAIQVWKKASDLERLKKGEEVESWGTSFVFVKYEGDDAMKVLHYDRVDPMKKSNFEVWIGANLTSR